MNRVQIRESQEELRHRASGKPLSGREGENGLETGESGFLSRGKSDYRHGIKRCLLLGRKI